MIGSTSLMRSQEAIRRHFGTRWDASYEAGKRAMAARLAREHTIDLHAAAAAVDLLEWMGNLRFERRGQLGSWSLTALRPRKTAPAPAEAHAIATV